MTKMIAVGPPTRDDVEKLLLTDFPHMYTTKEGEPARKAVMISTDGCGLGLMDLETREVYTSLPLGDTGPVDVLAVMTVTEEMLAEPELNPAQEEKATSILAYSDDGGAKWRSYRRLPGTDRFVSSFAVASLVPDSMSYGDSNVRAEIEGEAEKLRESVLFSCHRGEVYNMARPEAVYCMEPGHEIIFADAERTPENDSYPQIANDILKPPEHEAVYRPVEPVPEHEWLEQYREHKAEWEERAAEKAAAELEDAELGGYGDAPGDDGDLGIG